MKNYLTIPIIFWSSFILVGVILKFLHIFSSVFIVIGFAGLMSYLIYQFFILKNNNKLVSSLLTLCVVFFCILFGGAFFNNGYPINYYGVVIFFISFLIIFIGILLKSLFIKNKNEKKN